MYVWLLVSRATIYHFISLSSRRHSGHGMAVLLNRRVHRRPIVNLLLNLQADAPQSCKVLLLFPNIEDNIAYFSVFYEFKCYRLAVTVYLVYKSLLKAFR